MTKSDDDGDPASALLWDERVDARQEQRQHDRRPQKGAAFELQAGQHVALIAVKNVPGARLPPT